MCLAQVGKSYFLVFWSNKIHMVKYRALLLVSYHTNLHCPAKLVDGIFGGFKKKKFYPWSQWILRKPSKKSLGWSCRPFICAQLFGSWPYFGFIILIWNAVNGIIFIIWYPPVSWRAYQNQRDIPLSCVRTSSYHPENILQETLHEWMIISHRQIAIKLCFKNLNGGFQKQRKKPKPLTFQRLSFSPIKEELERQVVKSLSSIFKVNPSVKKKKTPQLLSF